MNSQGDNSQNKVIHLKQVWRRYALRYLAGVLTAPLLGIGLYLIWRTWKIQSERTYRITDRQITAIDSRYHQTIDLYNIDEVLLRQTALQRWLNTGDVVLRTNSAEMTLAGMDHPAALQATVREAVSAIRESMNTEKRPRPPQPEHDPGTMERMDYLTGLWQQGLISNSDFDEERRHFE